ncbi:Succinyl-CoA ligase [ADP-forming] subunit alpha [Nonomuraea coxensis DSM 45129]|uniref:Succinyl-CoA ligase [ADP-forming] subunit alpha n=1 Tax=Nonomuraea coxensis DSM 45129 TaxID=1122611 RepID=A0ABX8U278_9ACTN|nr:GNAT family N-acetyltransferase [Nonomuraea coxensis]QYC41852.1 Succinyl-CoA ligase [ADP-forming] subunit alpha [Nonomuraea coxensis DSM 45129]
MSDGYDVLLRDGGIAHVRPLRPGDRAALHELVERSSERSAYLRFFTGGRNTAHAYMDRITSDVYSGHALVAGLRGRLVAVAEYIPVDGGPAEGRKADLAILIDDAAHGHGLGTLLLEHLALDAAAHGVRTLVADVLAENRPMIQVLRDLGLDVARRFEGGMTHIDIAARPTARLRAGIEARDHQAARASLARVLSPRSVAVIGAGGDERSLGRQVLRNLLDAGFRGPIHPVGPHAAEVAGLPCHTRVPDGVDLAVVALPARHVLEAARDCARAGVAGLVVLTPGFAEDGRHGAEEELRRVCRAAGMRLVGPNCLGLINTGIRLNAACLPHQPVRGRLALMSQPGTAGAALLERLAVSSFVSVGNKADVSGNDLLEYWEDDPDTDVIALCLESFGNPRKFARIARRVGRTKPVLLVMSGRGDAGRRAVHSRAAAALTPGVAVDTLARAAGVIRLDSPRELIGAAELLAGSPLPAGRRVAVVGNSGALLARAADACERRGLTLSELLDGRAAAPGNPVDLTAGATAAEIGAAVADLAASPEVDAVLVVCAPPFGSGLEATRRAIAEATGTAGKATLACLAGHDGLIDGRIPSYASPEQAVAALSHVVRYAEWRRGPAEPADADGDVDVDDRAVRKIIEADPATPAEGHRLSPAATARLLACYGVALHADGPDAGKTGADVQSRPAGVEMIVGGVNHPSYGPLVMAGMGPGGPPHDRVFRVAPVADATGMVEELRRAALPHGHQGAPPVDARAPAALITRVGRLLSDLPQVAELDLDPVIVTEDGVVAAGARIWVAPCEPPSPLLRRLR